jgi:catechol 2,3-dioxygenase-like lactoylglutathione lyase family enzyme
MWHMKMIKTIPALPVQDTTAAADFYRDKFGFTIAYQEEGFVILKRDEIQIHLWGASDNSWKQRSQRAVEGAVQYPVLSGAESFIAGTASCRIEVTGIDELFAEYQTSGVLYNNDSKVEAQPWGTREFDTLDLERNLLTFFERT